MTATAPTFIRWIWPKLSHCPECACRKWTHAGKDGRVSYRRCTQCRKPYPMLPVAREVDRGGQVSEVEPV